MEDRIDYKNAREVWRKVQTKKKDGTTTEQWQVQLRFKVQDGVDENGRIVYKNKSKSKLFPPNVDTDRKRKTALREWKEDLEREQTHAEEYRAKLEEKARAEEERAAAEKERENRAKVYETVCTFIGTLQGSGSTVSRTIDDYKSSAKHLKCFEDVALEDLTRDMIQNWINRLNASLAPLTVRKCYQLLKRVYDQAVEDEVVASNPCASKKIMLPKSRPSRDKNALSTSDMPKVAELLRSKVQTPYIIAAQIAQQTGLREGEICAIRWRDVNFDSRELTVYHGITRGNHGSDYAETKRASSDRVIPINEELEPVLKERYDSMLKECVAAGYPTDERSFGKLFVIGNVEGKYYDPHMISRNWKIVAEIEGLEGIAGNRLTFHDLRHSYATVAIASGADVAAVASNLGHSDAHITLKTYANADPMAKRDASARVGRSTRAKRVARSEAD